MKVITWLMEHFPLRISGKSPHDLPPQILPICCPIPCAGAHILQRTFEKWDVSSHLQAQS